MCLFNSAFNCYNYVDLGEENVGMGTVGGTVMGRQK